MNKNKYLYMESLMNTEHHSVILAGLDSKLEADVALPDTSSESEFGQKQPTTTGSGSYIICGQSRHRPIILYGQKLWWVTNFGRLTVLRAICHYFSGNLSLFYFVM